MNNETDPELDAEIRKGLQNRQETREMLGRYTEHCTHAVTLTLKQTTLVTNELGQSYVRLTQEHAQKTLRHALNRLDYALWRKHQPCLLVLPTLEGMKGRDRLHYHLEIGNLPKGMTTEELTSAFRKAWKTTDFGNTQIDVQELFGGSRWLYYITKELGVKDTDCVDWVNVRIPKHLRQS